MDWFLLTPDSIRSFSLVLLNAVLAVYVYRLQEKRSATWWLFVFAVSISVFYLMRFIQASVFPMEAWGLFSGVPFAIEFVCVPVATGAFIQFAYTFIDRPFQREARIVRWVTIIICVVFLGLSGELFGGARPSGVHYMMYTTWWFFAFCGAAVIFLRKRVWCLANEQSQDARERGGGAYRALAWLSAFFAFILVAILLVMVLGLSETIWNVLILPGVFFFFSALAIVFVSYTPEPVTFQARIVALPLATMMVALGMASVISFSSAGILSNKGILPSDGEGIRMTPDRGGGYEIQRILLPVGDELGEQIVFEGATYKSVSLDFSMPYYGRLWDQITVSSSGFILLGHIQDSASVVGSYGVFEGQYPLIAPLFVNIATAPRVTPNSARAFIRRSSSQVDITWQFTSLSDSDVVSSVYMTLDQNGIIHFNYKNLHPFVESSDQQGISSIWRGAYPGRQAASVESLVPGVQLTQRISGDAGVFEDIALSLRQYTHERTQGLFALLLALSLLVLLLFPIVLRTGLLHPIERLVNGMRRVNDGDRDVRLPVGAQDEIGRLIAYFNTMTDSLKDAEQALRVQARELEHRVEERTAALQKSTEQLEFQAKKLQELDAIKTRFFANISHELRTPLTLLLGPLEDLKRGALSAKRIERYAPIMYRNVQRLLTLINQLLDLSKLEAGGLDLHPKHTEMVGFLRSLFLSFTPRAEREGLSLLFESSSEKLNACVDPDKMEKIVVNLVANSFKFTESGGKVRLMVDEGVVDDIPHLMIVVEDTGKGIPASALPRLFDRFYQVDGTATREYEGSGIGLALVKELTELHRGAVRVESKLGFGTMFTVSLPLNTLECLDEINTTGEYTEPDLVHPVPEVEKDDQNAFKDTLTQIMGDGDIQTVMDMEEGEQHKPVSKQASVLIIDDNSDMRLFLRDHLEKDYHVHEAENGQVGLERTNTLLPDLVICDAMMPEMDGFAVCNAIKAESSTSHIPVLMVTARASEESKLDGFRHGADDYITKPFSIEELKARLENHIQIRQSLRKKFSQEVIVGPNEIVVSSADSEWLDRVKKIVESRLGDRAFSVEMLADEVGMSTRNLQRTLKRVTSLSPHGYIRTMRLERAAQLLEQNAGTVSEVAHAVGFNDPEYFSKLFRQVFGASPSAYKKQ